MILNTINLSAHSWEWISEACSHVIYPDTLSALPECSVESGLTDFQSERERERDIVECDTP